MTVDAKRDGYGVAPGIAAVIACLLVAAAAALVCHAVMDETYHPGDLLRDLGIFLADVLAFSTALCAAGIVSLIVFIAARRKKAALLALVPACLGPLILLGVYLLFKFGV